MTIISSTEKKIGSPLFLFSSTNCSIPIEICLETNEKKTGYEICFCFVLFDAHGFYPPPPPAAASFCLRKHSPTGKKSQLRCWYMFQTYVSWPVYSVSGLLIKCIKKNL